jgi:hypothetical protein
MSIQVVCMEHFPAQIFRDKNGPVAVLYAQKVLAGATANQSIIAAVTGKVIRVLTMYMVSDGALITTGNLLDGSGGTTKFAIATPPNTVSPCPPFQFNPAGWGRNIFRCWSLWNDRPRDGFDIFVLLHRLYPMRKLMLLVLFLSGCAADCRTENPLMSPDARHVSQCPTWRKI